MCNNTKRGKEKREEKEEEEGVLSSKKRGEKVYLGNNPINGILKLLKVKLRLLFFLSEGKRTF